MEIPFFNYKHVYGQYKSEFNSIIQDIITRGSFILQKEGDQFESNLSNYLNTKYALGVANCTDGLYLSLKAAGVGSGDEVIFSSHTFVATASSIYNNGAKPIPVECGADHLIDPDSIEQAITKRTKAIVPTQLNGHVCDMNKILNICEKYNILLVEDAAQSLGAKYKNKFAGTFGQSAAFSFYPAKVVGCFGDGGAVVTDNVEIFNKIRLLRNHGRPDFGEVECWGINSRLDNIHAAILDFKLKQYNKDITRRRELAVMYFERLKDLNEIKLPRDISEDIDKFEVYQNYEIELRDSNHRDKLKDYLKSNGIGTILQWGGKAVHQFKALEFNISLPRTEKIMSSSLLLPMNTSLSDSEIYYICDAIHNYFN